MKLVVGVLDDEADVRGALAATLRREGFDALELEDTVALLALAREGRAPRIVLADLDLDGERFADAAPALFALAPETQVVALTGHAEDGWLFPAIEAGCVGYLLKSDARTRLGDVIRDVETGGSPMTREISRRVLARLRKPASVEPAANEPAASGPAASGPVASGPVASGPAANGPAANEIARPSERELAVLQQLAEGYTYDQIALRLDVSLASVRTYVRRVYTKLGVNTKSEATHRAMRLGFLE